ncbi:MAG: hypothetical protein QG575_544 [Euryarchaeota archaeon]|nr:hypothetical protein [Euryarchaeota archaeon]
MHERITRRLLEKSLLEDKCRLEEKCSAKENGSCANWGKWPEMFWVVDDIKL